MCDRTELRTERRFKSIRFYIRIPVWICYFTISSVLYYYIVATKYCESNYLQFINFSILSSTAQIFGGKKKYSCLSRYS